MSGWTQPICGRCYAQKEPRRQPLRMKAEYAKTERCCFCGEETREGIYYRVKPGTCPYPRPEE